MQPNKTKLALQIGAVVLGALCASNSYADTFTATVTTIDDVQITERVPLTFGNNVFTTAGTCTLPVTADTGAAGPGGVLMRYDRSDTQATPGTSFQVLSGTSCVTGGTGVTAGVWDITGIAGGTVSILLTTVAQSDPNFTYAPTGCYVSYSGDTADNGDSCDALTPGNVVSTPIALAALSEDDSTGGGAGSGVAVGGSLSFAVGGTITVGAGGLVAETPYDLAFQVDVTY